MDSSLVKLLSLGSSNSVVSIVSSLESSAKEMLPSVVSKAEAVRVLSSAQVVESRRERSRLGATLLSWSLEASERELASILDGVISAEASLNCDDSFKLWSFVVFAAVF